MTVTSDFRPEVEMWPFCACAIKYIHYNPYYMNSLFIDDSTMGRYHVPQNVHVFWISDVFGKIWLPCDFFFKQISKCD